MLRRIVGLRCRRRCTPPAGNGTCARRGHHTGSILIDIMRRVVWIVWLMLALLPLRGWAHGAMLVQMTQAPASQSQQAATDLPPCHQAMAATESADAADASDTLPSHTVCALCDLCHGVLAAGGGVAAVVHALPGDAPAARLSVHAARGAAHSIFRPPRALHV
jgi:hypothetical protein